MNLQKFLICPESNNREGKGCPIPQHCAGECWTLRLFIVAPYQKSCWFLWDCADSRSPLRARRSENNLFHSSSVNLRGNCHLYQPPRMFWCCLWWMLISYLYNLVLELNTSAHRSSKYKLTIWNYSFITNFAHTVWKRKILPRRQCWCSGRALELHRFSVVGLHLN